MSARWIALSCVLAAAASCSGKQATEIVVVVATDLTVPAEINKVALQVHYLASGVVTGKIEDLVADKQIEVNWDLGSVTGTPAVQLPATIGLLAGKDLSQRVLITVQGMKEKKEITRRQALLTFAPGRIVVVHLNLLRRCALPVGCSERETCGEDGCEPLVKDPSKLPDYSPIEVGKHFFDGRVVDQRRDGPGADIRSDGPGRDAKGDLAKSDAKVDVKKVDTKNVDAAKVDAKKIDAAKVDAKKIDAATVDAKKIDAATVDAKKIDAAKDKNLIAPLDLNPSCSGWTVLSPGTNANLNGVWGSSDTDVWVAGGPYGSLKCTMLHYDGAVWGHATLVENGCGAALNAVSGATGSDFHVVGNYRGGMPSGIEAWHFDGASWQNKLANNMGMFQGVWVAPTGGDAFAARSFYIMGAPSISKYTTATGSWNTDTTAPASSFAAVWGTSSSNVFIVGNVNGSNSADVRVSSAGWLSIPPATTKTLRAAWGLSSDLFVVGDDGTIWRNQTITMWFNESVAGGPTLRGVGGRGGVAQRIFAVGDKTSIYERPKLSATWQQVCSNPAGLALNAIWCNPVSNCCIAVGDGGLVLQRCLL